MADLFAAADPALAEREGIEVLEEGGVLALSVATLSGSRTFNHAFGISCEADLDAVDRFYRTRNCAYVLSPAPGRRLDSLLEQRGLSPDYGWMKFTRAAALDSAPSELRVERIGPEHSVDLGRIVSAAFAAPAWVADWVATLART